MLNKSRKRFAVLVMLAAAGGLSVILSAGTSAASSGEAAREILAASGVKGGLVVHLGCDDGRLTAALRADEGYLVHGLDRDPSDVREARRHVRSLGLYGAVSIDVREGQRLPYADGLVALIVAEEADAPPVEEMMRVLAPRGAACVKRDGRWTTTVKPWPDDIDEWTHFLHGPEGNAVARDTTIGVPRRVRWTAGPRWSTHHNRVPNVSAMVSADGRLFYILNDVPPGAEGDLPGQWYLCCREAFSGILQWKIPVEPWGWQAWSTSPVTSYRNIGGRFNQPPQVSRTLVADGDRLFATLGYDAPVSAVDAVNGELLATYNGTEGADELLQVDGRLVAAVHTRSLAERKKAALRQRRSDDGPPPGRKRVVAMDPDTGEVLWRSGPYTGINANRGLLSVHRHLNPVAGGGRVYLVTRKSLVSLDLETGEELWKTPRPPAPRHETRYDMNANDMVTLVHHGGTLFFAQLVPRQRLGWQETIASVHAFSASDGQEIWSRPCASWGWGTAPDLFVTDGLVWVWGRDESPLLGLNPRTGEVVRKRSNFRTFDINHHHRCYRNKATSRFLLTSWRGLELIPWSDGERCSYGHWWFRAACRHGFLPANGLVYNSPNPCVCYLKARLAGFNALAPEPAEPQKPVSDAERLRRGPAYPPDEDSPAAPQDADWPAYRHDACRSGCTSASVPSDLRQPWSAELGGTATQAVIAGDRAFVAVPDRFRVRAFDAADGTPLWTFTAGGRVDTPPTCYRGLLLFGCGDGRVYCLRARDGSLVWSFLAAPTRRRIVADGRLEAAWPVHGSVIVRDGRAYVIAGRSSFLEGGFATWVLDARTGRILQKGRLSDVGLELPEARVGAQRGPGVTSDVPVTDGRSIYMRGKAVFTDLAGPPERRPLLSPRSRFLDRTWFNRASQWQLGRTFYGEYLVSDGDTAFAFKAYESLRRNTDLSFFTPGRGSYELYSCRVADGPGKRTPADEQIRWKRKVGIAVRAMVAAGPHLFVAGAPDEVPEDDPWKHLEGRGRGVLQCVSASTGRTLSELRLSSPPVLDGLSAAHGRLYVSTRDGRLVCLTAVGGRR